MGERILVTGASGHLGGLVVRRLLTDRPSADLVILTRDPERWAARARALRVPAARVTAIVGDPGSSAAAFPAATRDALRRDFTAIVHLAADTDPGADLARARAVNVRGTERLLEFTAPGGSPICFVSTAFVAGLRSGRIAETDPPTRVGWANAHEQSKAEAEDLVRASGRDFVILRPSTIVCDDQRGRILRHGAIHRILRLLHDGLAPLLPGRGDTLVDVIPADFAASAIAELATRPDLRGATVHLCAGDGAAPLDRIIAWSWEVWSENPLWRRRSISPPALTDLSTYRLFEIAAEETGDARLTKLIGTLGHFVPHLAHAKRFHTGIAEAALGHGAPPVAMYWRALAADLARRAWTTSLDTAA